MSKLNCQIRKKNDLKEKEITAMYKLAEASYVKSNPTEFLLELAKMEYVILFRNKHHEIKGFQEYKMIQLQEKGQKVRGVLAKGLLINREDSICDDVMLEIEKLYEQCLDKYKKIYLFVVCQDGQLFPMFNQTGKRLFPNDKFEMPKEYLRIRKLAGKSLYHSYYNDVTGQINHRYGTEFLYITELSKK